MPTLSNNPKETMIDSIAVPPYEIKGKGMPTTGIKPVTIAIFNTTYINTLLATPKHIIRPNI